MSCKMSPLVLVVVRKFTGYLIVDCNCTSHRSGSVLISRRRITSAKKPTETLSLQQKQQHRPAAGRRREKPASTKVVKTDEPISQMKVTNEVPSSTSSMKKSVPLVHNRTAASSIKLLFKNSQNRVNDTDYSMGIELLSQILSSEEKKSSTSSAIDYDSSCLLSGLGKRSRPKTQSSKKLRETNTTGRNDGEFSLSTPLPALSSQLSRRQQNTIVNSNSDPYFELYLEMLNEIIETDRWRKKHTKKAIKEDVVQSVAAWLRCHPKKSIVSYKNNLKTFQTVMQQHVCTNDQNVHNNNKHDNGTVSQTQKQFRSELKLQEEAFLKQYQNPELFNTELAQDTLYHLSCMCARNARGMPASVIWEKVKEMGITDQNLLQHLLYVASTFTISSSKNSKKQKRPKYRHLVSSATSSILDVLDSMDEIENHSNGSDDGVEEDTADLIDEIAVYHDLLHKPTEASLSIRVRLLVSHGRAKEAETIILGNSKDVRLRACLPVLRLHLEQGNLAPALSLYQRMQNKSIMPLVYFDVEAYMHVLAGLAENGAFSQPPNDVQDGVEVVTSQPSSAYLTYGPGLFDQVMEDMAVDIIELPEHFTKRLYDAFAKGDPSGSLEVTESLAPLRLSCERAADGDLVLNRVRIDPSKGVCPRTGVKLRLIAITDLQKQQLKSSITKMAKNSKSSESVTIPKKKRTHSADNNLIQFLNWLDRRNGEPYTAIVDGANVGYYFQNFQSGRFSYHQIKFVVDSLEQKGETVMVIIPSKYSKDYFYNSIGGQSRQTQYLTEAEKRIRDELQKSGKMFPVPPGFLDDYYWILASVAEQGEAKRSSGRESLIVPVDDTKGRWPGTRPILITNDQMRDHKLEMLEPMIFRRWCSNYIVNYNFTPFVDGECPNPDIGFAAADFFSREIQGNKDETLSMVWHFPIQDKEDEWFCVRIPNKITKS